MGAFGNKKVLGPSNRSVSACNVTHKSVTFPMVRCSFVKHPLPSYRDLSLWGWGAFGIRSEALRCLQLALERPTGVRHGSDVRVGKRE